MTRSNIGFPTSHPEAAMAPAPPSTSSTPSSTMTQHSPWHSPVPYLFGGLAAMLGLIALALLILACSYWRLSGYPARRGANDDDVEDGNGDGSKSGHGGTAKGVPVFEEKVLVIMAGEKLPTFLATPVFPRAGASKADTSLGDNNKADAGRRNDVDGGEGRGDGGAEAEAAGTVPVGTGGSEAVLPPPPALTAAEVGGGGQRGMQQSTVLQQE